MKSLFGLLGSLLKITKLPSPLNVIDPLKVSSISREVNSGSIHCCFVLMIFPMLTHWLAFLPLNKSLAVLSAHCKHKYSIKGSPSVVSDLHPIVLNWKCFCLNVGQFVATIGKRTHFKVNMLTYRPSKSVMFTVASEIQFKLKWRKDGEIGSAASSRWPRFVL